MKKILLQFLTISVEETSSEDIEHALRVATAVLLIEIVRADFVVEASERERLRELLRQQFLLSDSELDALLDEAESDADRLVSIQHITRLMNLESGSTRVDLGRWVLGCQRPWACRLPSRTSRSFVSRVKAVSR